MLVYYTHEYKGGSHDLLEKVAAPHKMDEIEYGEQGKPFISAWKPFSISHSENTWAVLVADDDCGLDVQYEKQVDFLKLAERWYNTEELESLKKLSEDEVIRREFFRIWSRREALVKAAGTSIANSSLPSVLADNVSYEGSLWMIMDVTVPGAENLHAAVCSREIDEIKVVELSDR